MCNLYVGYLGSCPGVFPVIEEPMSNASPVTLSDGQKACLRLVAQGMSSKEIAPRLGLTPQTVDTYIKAAMGRLGALNRRDAARMLAESEVSQKLVSPPEAIVAPPATSDQEPEAERRRLTRRVGLPPIGGTENRLDATGRMLAALRVALVGSIVVIALVLLLAALLRTFR